VRRREGSLALPCHKPGVGSTDRERTLAALRSPSGTGPLRRAMGAASSHEGISIPRRFLEQAERPEAQVRLAAGLPAKRRRIADSPLVALAREAYGCTTHPALSRCTKLLGAAALSYLIAPLDAVADWAWAIVSLADGRQVLALALPFLVLAALLAFRWAAPV